ncbi:MAG: carbohydrate-binding domain-containing protein [Bacteroidales bacterium]|nr:carbohydrate-binding domain-containing protein [Bacteroidales bacterium]
MKRVLLLLLATAVAFTACNTDVIGTTEDPVDTSFKDNDDDDDPEEAQGDYDDISLTSFTRTISISWNGSSVSVSGDDNGVVSVSGADVTVDNTGHDEFVRYELSGNSSDGCLKIYSLRRLALVMNGLDLTNPSGAAINVQTHKRTFVVLNGSNTLADGSVNSSGDYPDEVSTEDMKAAFFSEAQLIFSGSGSLSVTANGKAAITSDDYLRFMGTQSVSATSANGHALRGKDAVTVDDGTIAASTSAAGKKGMTSDGAVTINGGTIHIKVSGGTVAEQVTTNGTTSTEYTGSAGIKADSTFVMNAGELYISNSGTGGKGISGDQNALFKGGTVSVSVTGSNYGASGTKAGPGGGWPGGGGGFPGGGGDNQSSSSKSAKGIKFDGNIVISGGNVSVTATAHEAIESKGTLEVTGGTLYAYSAADDAINSAGDMTLSGGYVCGWSAGNDGIDANGNMYLKGACVYALCTKGSPEVALDANTEGGKKLYIQSGTLVAIGGIESGSSITGSAYSTSSWTKNAWHAVYDKNGNAVFAFKTPSSSSNSTMVVYSGGSTAGLKSGVSTSGGTSIWGDFGYAPGSVSGGTSITLSSYSGGYGRF